MNNKKYNENQKMIKGFFMCFDLYDSDHLVEMLEDFCNFKGHGFSEYEMCRFPHEIDEDDEGYFDKGVGFYFFEPVYEKDSYMVLDYNEFYNEVYKAYQKYIGKRPEIKDKVTELLKKLEEKMTAASNDEIEKQKNIIKI